MPIAQTNADMALADAKAELMNSAKAIDPLAALRKRPIMTVGVAAGVGALLGMKRWQLFTPGRLSPTAVSLIRFAVTAAERHLTARLSQSRPETASVKPEGSAKAKGDL